MRHKWKARALKSALQIQFRERLACGLEHRKMRQPRHRRTIDEYRRKGEPWRRQQRIPECTAMQRCGACAGRGMVPKRPSPTTDERLEELAKISRQRIDTLVAEGARLKQAAITKQPLSPETLDQPCPHPSRASTGRHKTYLERGRFYCRACGANAVARNFKGDPEPLHAGLRIRMTSKLTVGSSIATLVKFDPDDDTWLVRWDGGRRSTWERSETLRCGHVVVRDYMENR